MINRNSKSYPYLAIAQHYNVPYVEVLKFVDMLDDVEAETVIGLDWQNETFNIWTNKNDL